MTTKLATVKLPETFKVIQLGARRAVILTDVTTIHDYGHCVMIKATRIYNYGTTREYVKVGWFCFDPKDVKESIR